MAFKFQSFLFSQPVLLKYLDWFQDKKNQGVLYQGTPKTTKQVKAWLLSCIQDENKHYFLVYQGQEIIGHIGLKEIKENKGWASIGSFFTQPELRQGKAMEEALEFIINQAKKLNLKLLTADFKDPASRQIEPFLKAGFKRTPLAPHYLTSKIG